MRGPHARLTTAHLSLALPCFLNPSLSWPCFLPVSSSPWPRSPRTSELPDIHTGWFWGALRPHSLGPSISFPDLTPSLPLPWRLPDTTTWNSSLFLCGQCSLQSVHSRVGVGVGQAPLPAWTPFPGPCTGAWSMLVNENEHVAVGEGFLFI